MYNGVTRKSSEEGLITKKCITMQIIFYGLSWAVYFSGSVTKLFKSGTKLLYTEIITVKLEPSLLLNMSLFIHPLSFITEALPLLPM